jgi:hypothetical protein
MRNLSRAANSYVATIAASTGVLLLSVIVSPITFAEKPTTVHIKGQVVIDGLTVQIQAPKEPLPPYLEVEWMPKPIADQTLYQENALFRLKDLYQGTPQHCQAQ